MRVLLSTIGSRGDVQPLVALALAADGARPGRAPVRAARLPRMDRGARHAGHADRARAALRRGRRAHAATAAHAGAAPPDDRGHRRHAVRDDRGGRAGLRRHRRRDGAPDRRAVDRREDGHPVRLRRLLPGRAAVARITRRRCSPWLGDKPVAAMPDYSELWAQDAQRWNDLWVPILNAHRAALGLAPVDDVRGHVLTERPWLAADPTLAPWPDPRRRRRVPDGRVDPARRASAVAPRSRRSSTRATPPIYFGFGSIRGAAGPQRA